MRLNCRIHDIKVTRGYDIFLHILEDDKPVYITSRIQTWMATSEWGNCVRFGMGQFLSQ